MKGPEKEGGGRASFAKKGGPFVILVFCLEHISFV